MKSVDMRIGTSAVTGIAAAIILLAAGRTLAVESMGDANSFERTEQRQPCRNFNEG